MNSAIFDGFKLMLLGMGMVFLFLVCMILFINLTSIILRMIQSRLPVPVAPLVKAPQPVGNNLMKNKELVDVLSQAISTYKADK